MVRSGGHFAGAPLHPLHTVGARTGKLRLNPMMYLRDGDRVVVFASKGGHPHNPDWYHNLKAHPDVKMEVGDDAIDVHVEEAVGAEHERLYQLQASRYPRFGDYQRKTKRVIPVMILTKTR